MRQYLKLKPRVKKPKPVAIESYKVSYLDKRSKSYHRIVMTAFAGLFGFVGVLYVFSSSAATGETSTNNNESYLSYVLIALVVLFMVVLAAYFYSRRR